MRAYAIFQGGGAKGFAHVGALHAAEERGIRFTGVAGTSIGAVVAALVAAGYAANELYATDGRSPAGALDIDPVEVIDEDDWREIEAFQAAATKFVGRPMTRLRDKVVNLWMRQLPFAISQRRMLARLSSEFGLTETAGLVAWIDRLLSEKVAPSDGQRVRFKDLGIPLRVVAADIASGTTRIFGGEADGEMAVADAVAASACYPGLFMPVCIGDNQYVDGGLVSNLPAWVFDSERGTDPGFVPTFGIRFVDTDASTAQGPRRPADFLKFARRLIDTAVSGASELESRGIDDYYAVDLAVDVPTLSFSGLKERAPSMIEGGRSDVLRFFESTVGPQDPERMRIVLRVTAIMLRRRLGINGRVRAYILMRQGSSSRAKVFYSAGMETDPDDRMTLDVDDPGPASPLIRREPVLVRYLVLAQSPGGPYAKYERAMRPDSVMSAYSVPIFSGPLEWLKADPANRSDPYGCLVIDAEEDLRSTVLDEEVENLLAAVAQLVGEYVRGWQGNRPARQRPTVEDTVSGWQSFGANGGCLVSTRKARDPSDGPETTDILSAIERALSTKE